MVHRSIVGHWASERGKAEFNGLHHSGCPVTAVSPEMLQHNDAIVCEDQCITTQQLALSFLISKESVNHT
jgi:hypothetical protein